MLRAAGRVVVVAALFAACVARTESVGVVAGPDGPPRRQHENAPEASLSSDALAVPLDASVSSADASSPPAEVAAPGEPPSPAPSVCPDAMILVDGDDCTDVKETCLEWLDPPEHNPLARCAKYAPTECVGVRLKRRFCIDRDEYVPPGQSLPLGDVSWTKASALCKDLGKRLCLETEWELACGGDAMLPYPTGYERDAKICNFDRDPLLDKKGELLDLREPEDAGDKCVSPYGVRNMSGNVDEWVERDRTWGVWRSGLKGGWWMAARDRCRPATTAHDEWFHELQTGVRCCADAPPAPRPAPSP